MPFPVLVGDIGGTNARFALLGDARSEAKLFDPVRTGTRQARRLCAGSGPVRRFTGRAALDLLRPRAVFLCQRRRIGAFC